MPEITCITCSYNKIGYVADAIKSVLEQTFADFEYLILENSDDGVTREKIFEISNQLGLYADERIRIEKCNYTKRQRKDFYPESALKNFWFPEAKGKYIIYLADDDVLEPQCFQSHLDHFISNGGVKANYHSQRTSYVIKGAEQNSNTREAGLVYNATTQPSCAIDGGSVMFEKDLLRKIKKPYFTLNWNLAHVSDGLFMNKLAEVADIHPIKEVLHTKRVTEISTHEHT